MEFQSSDEVRGRRTERLAEAGKRRLRGISSRPEAPRGVKFADGIVTWEEPRETSNVTHYVVYAGAERVRVPAGSTMIAGIDADLVSVAAYNEASDLESARQMAVQEITVVTESITTADGQGPSGRLALGDWDVVVGALGKNEQTGEQMARLDFTVNQSFCQDHTDISVFGVWFYKGDADPSDLSQFVPLNANQTRPASGPATWSANVSRDLTDSTWWFMIIPQTPTFSSVPTDTDSYKSLVVSAVTPPPQVIDFGVEFVGPVDRGGLSSGHWKFTWENPNDPEYWRNDIEFRRMTDNTFTTVAADWQGYFYSDVAFEQANWWALGVEEFWQCRCRTESRSGRFSDYGDILNVTVPSATAVAGGATPPSARLGSADWSVTIDGLGRNAQTGEEQARFKFEVTAAFIAAHGDIAQFTVWYCKSATTPALADYASLNASQTAFAGGSTWYALVPRDLVDTTWWFLIVPHTPTYYSVPESGDIVKSKVLTAPAAPPMLTGFAPSLVTQNRGGVPSARWKFDGANPSDPEYWETKIEFRPCNAAWSPTGEWSVYFNRDTFPFEQSGWWPLPAAAEYWQCRYRTHSRSDIYSAYSATFNLTVSASAGVTANTPPRPGVPGTSDWSVSVTALGPNAQTGVNQARVSFTVTAAWCAAHPDVSNFTAYVYKGSSVPGDRSLFTALASQARPTNGTSAATWDSLIDRESTSQTYQCIIVAHSPAYWSTPDPADTVKSFTVTPTGIPGLATDFNIQVLTGEAGGVKVGRLKVSFTVPSDLEYWTTKIERVQCDAAFTPLAGKSYELVFDADYSFEQQESWVLPAATQYWLWRYRSMSRANVYSAYSTTYQMTLTANGGINLGAADPGSIGTGLASDGNGKIVNTSTDGANVLNNPSFEYGLTEWIWNGNGAMASDAGVYYTGAHSAKFTGATSGCTQYAICKPGDQFRAEAYMQSPTGSQTAWIYVRFTDGVSQYAVTGGDNPSPYTIGTGWTSCKTAVFTAPAGAKKVAFIIYLAASPGPIYVDNCLLVRVQPVGGGLGTDTSGSVVVSPGVGLEVDAGGFLKAKTSTGLTADANGIRVPAGAITNSLLAALAVATTNLQNGAVDATKIANLAVGTAHIQYAAITTALIANAAITNALIGNAAVGTANIQDASITDAKIDTLSVGKLIAGTATFTGDVILRRTVSGVVKGSMTLSGTGLILDSGSGPSVQISTDKTTISRDLEVTGGGGTYATIFVTTAFNGAQRAVIAVGNGSHSVQMDGVNGRMIVDGVNGATGPTTVQFKDSSNTPWTMTVRGGIVTQIAPMA